MSQRITGREDATNRTQTDKKPMLDDGRRLGLRLSRVAARPARLGPLLHQGSRVGSGRLTRPAIPLGLEAVLPDTVAPRPDCLLDQFGELVVRKRPRAAVLRHRPQFLPLPVVG